MRQIIQAKHEARVQSQGLRGRCPAEATSFRNFAATLQQPRPRIYNSRFSANTMQVCLRLLWPRRVELFEFCEALLGVRTLMALAPALLGQRLVRPFSNLPSATTGRLSRRRGRLAILCSRLCPVFPLQSLQMHVSTSSQLLAPTSRTASSPPFPV